MTEDPYHIARVFTLTGYTTPETAYMVDDYPYGSLRCKIRFWIETATKGQAKGQQRFVRQTTNPKRPGHPWNKPHASTYKQFAMLYLDDKNHVQWHAIPFWIMGEDDVRARHMGVYDALSPSDRKVYDYLLKRSRHANPTSWAEWENKTATLARYLAEHDDTPPELVNHVWRDGKTPHYLNDPAACITAAREMNAAN